MTAKHKRGWYVEIVEFGVDAAAKTLGPYHDEKTADKADSGANRNLNHSKFFTRIVEVKS